MESLNEGGGLTSHIDMEDKSFKNLVPVGRGEIEAFFQIVMDDLGYRGWQLRWMPADAYCWRGKQIIDICLWESLAECKQLLLHEIAHIGIVEPSGNQHTLRFWNHLQYLVRTYLDSELDIDQEQMAQIYCPEFLG